MSHFLQKNTLENTHSVRNKNALKLSNPSIPQISLKCPYLVRFFRMIPYDVTLWCDFTIFVVINYVLKSNFTYISITPRVIVVNNINVVGLCIILVNNIVRTVPKMSWSRSLKMEKNVFLWPSMDCAKCLKRFNNLDPKRVMTTRFCTL